MGFNYGTKLKHSRKCAENIFPNILAYATVCLHGGWLSTYLVNEAPRHPLLYDGVRLILRGIIS